MNLPADETARDTHRNWIVKESVGSESGAHILVPEASKAVNQYDMYISLPWCGIVDYGVSEGDEFTMHVTEGIQIDTDEIAGGAGFVSFGQDVWFDPTNNNYNSAEVDGYYLVGYVIIPTNDDGVMRFEKRRYVEIGETT